MKKLWMVLLVLLGVPSLVAAQPCYSTKGQLEYCNALTPAVHFGFPRYTTAALPTCDTNNKGAVAYNTTDSEYQGCDGSVWAAIGGSGSGDVTAVGDCASGACFNGTQGTVLTFNNAGGDGTLDYDGTDFSISKPISVTGTIALTSTFTLPDNVRQTFNPGADAAGLNVGAVASDPGTPSNGDVWYDSGNNTLDARINGSTVSLGAGGGAPTDATYITQTANGSLSNEQALGALATGCLGSTTTTGVVAARTITGTANEVSIANGDCSGNPTASLPATIDLGGKTSFEIPNGAAPTVDAFGEIAGDNDLWAASRGAPIFFDGTASTALVNVLVSDAPANGECPKWNTGGTITWETCAGGISGTDTQVLFFDGANNPAGEAGFTYNKTTDSVTLAGDATFSGGDVNAGTTAVQGVFHSLNTGTTGMLLQSDTAASGGTDYGVKIQVTGNLLGADRVLCIDDNAGSTCALAWISGDGSANFNGTIDSGAITSSSNITAGGAARFITSGRTRWGASAQGVEEVSRNDNAAQIIRRFTGVPTIGGSCGTTPAIAGVDSALKITTGTGSPTSCTVTFNGTWSTAPVCTANATATTTALNVATTTTTVIVSAAALTASETIHVLCMGY